MYSIFQNQFLRKILIIFGLFIIVCTSAVSENKINVLILPFENKGEMENDYISDLIVNSLISFFEITPNYKVMHLNDLKNYMNKNHLNIGDFQNKNKLKKISEDLQISNIIKGKYYEKNDMLIIDFEVIDSEIMKIIYRSSKFGEGNIYTFDTINNISSLMVEDFTGIKLNYGKINIQTDKECSVFVDNKKYGITPKNINLSTGSHKLKLIYKKNDKEKIIFNDYINIEKNKLVKLNLKVYVDIDIDAEKQCNVYINNKLIGQTPVKTNLFTGYEYSLKITYIDDGAKEQTIIKDAFSTKEGKDIKLNYSLTGSIFVKADNQDLKASLNKNDQIDLPYKYENLFFGKYHLDIFIFDEKLNKNHSLFKKNIKLNAGENKIINMTDFRVKRMYGLCFIPSASQMYTKQYKKGAVLLTGFLTSLTLGLVALPISQAIYYNDYLFKLNSVNKYGFDKSGFTQNDLDVSYNTVIIVFCSMLITGMTTAFIFYLASLIDGFVNIYRINKLLNPEKNKHLKVSFSVRIDHNYY